jgi:hypothetical protein
VAGLGAQKPRSEADLQGRCNDEVETQRPQMDFLQNHQNLGIEFAKKGTNKKISAEDGA